MNIVILVRKIIEKRKIGKKRDFLSRLITPTGTKGCASHVALAAPFVPVGVTNRDKR